MSTPVNKIQLYLCPQLVILKQDKQIISVSRLGKSSFLKQYQARESCEADASEKLMPAGIVRYFDV